jgi:hypothetical protein
VVCICYSMVGIPIFLIALANLIGTMTNLIKAIYSSIEQAILKLVNSRKKKQGKPNPDEVDTGATGSLGKPEELNSEIENSTAKAGKYGLEEDDQNCSDDEESEEDISANKKKANSNRKITVVVPLVVVLAIMAGYMAIGVFVYSSFESWNHVSAAYFTFITISTIGEF